MAVRVTLGVVSLGLFGFSMTGGGWFTVAAGTIVGACAVMPRKMYRS